MQKTMFYTQDIIKATGLSQQAIAKRAAQENWPFEQEKARGGTRKVYPLQALPIAIQAQLLRSYRSDMPTPEGEAKPHEYNKESLWAYYERATDKKKATAKKRVQYLLQLKSLMDNGHSFTEASRAVAKANSISAASLKNWWFGVNRKKGAKYYAVEDWLAAMVPGHVGHSKTAECSVEAWNYFKADYLRLEKPTATACYERLKLAAEHNNWQIPSLSTLERRIKAMPITTRTLLREGEHALMRLFPALERSIEQLHAMEWINGDGYMHNVFVKFKDGRIGRPKTWFWQDVYSRNMIAWRTDETENTDMIRLSFGDVVEKLGIPEHVTIDNTRAAANKWMTGGVPNRYRFKVKDDDPVGIFPMMGVQVHWTSVIAGRGHGQAKPVERAFGVGGLEEYIDKHPKCQGAYTGPNPTAKPENYGSTAIPIEEFEKIIAEGVAMFNRKAKRQTEACHGMLSFQEAFAQSYATATVRKATSEQRRLWMLTAEAIKVGRDGTIVLEAGAGRIGKNRYGNDALLQYRGQKIVVRFDPAQLHEAVHAYTLDGRYIGEVECLQAAGFGDSETGRKANRLRKQKMKATKIAATAEQGLSALEAAALLPPPEDEPPVISKVVQPVFAKASGHDVPTHYDDSADNYVIDLWNKKKANMENME